MQRIVLEGDTLGKKHQHYNKLVDEALSSNQLPEPFQDDDIRNLLSIDIASKNRNVDYILEVLKSEDQLLVSKAIKRSIWLITDPQYAHIITPEHLYTKLYPQMTSRAFNKLMLNIRLHLRDEKRVEGFYNYIKEKDIKSAYKWLQHCSVPFAEIEVDDHNHNIPEHLVLRLFEKSFSIFKSYKNKKNYTIEDGQFLLSQHTEEFLDDLENMKYELYFKFNSKNTKILMEKCPRRILDKFEFYGENLHIETFVKHLNKTVNIKDFLLKYGNNEKLKWLYTFDKMKHFIMQLPPENRFDYVKKVFIDKEILVNRDDIEVPCIPDYDFVMYSEEGINNSERPNTYQWYKYAPFNTAFADLINLIRVEFVAEQRNCILQVLLSCACRNMQHIQIVLQYFHDKHINESFKFKIQFMNLFISKVDIHILDDQAWNTLNQLFHSMEVYIESENNVQTCIQAIIVRNSIRKELVPDIIETKFLFDTLKTLQMKLKKQEEKDAVFEYLRNFVTTKANPLNLNTESEFNEAVAMCEHLLNLIKEWGKELQDHPSAINRVKELAKIKKEKKWNQDLSSLYNTKKSWRKVMFEESLALSPTEEVCLNALKHDSGLLSRNKELVLAIRCNDTISLRHLLRKIRIYWPQTFAEDYKTEYLKSLNQPNSHKAVIVGLCTLLHREQIKDLLKKYSPYETKIDWSVTNQLELSLQKQIAKNIHKARPLAQVEKILPYAKGDYLQYAVPSLNAILSQLSPNKSRLCIPKFLDAPVSLQKLGVRCAFHKLTADEMKPMFSEIWNSTKNSSIRTVIFTHTFDLLCRDKTTLQVNNTWDLLSMIIDSLTPGENKQIYQKLGQVSEVPDSVKPQFYMKSYTFLCSLPVKCNCENIIRSLDYKMTDLMEYLNEDFVIDVMLKHFNETLENDNNLYEKPSIITSFILASRDEETQVRRCEKTLLPILEKYLPQWEMICEGKYRIKKHIKDLLQKLVCNLEIYTIKKTMQIPVKTFESILLALENKMSYQKYYALLTSWKLASIFVKLLNENREVIIIDSEGEDSRKMTDEEYNYRSYAVCNKMHEQIGPQFAKKCQQHLKEDMSLFGSSIYSLFAVSLKTFLCKYLGRKICGPQHRLLYVKCFLQWGNEREFYLTVYRILADETEQYEYCTPEESKLIKEIHNIAMSQCSGDVKMQFFELFSNIAFPVSSI